jgi:hypothetical protein
VKDFAWKGYSISILLAIFLVLGMFTAILANPADIGIMDMDRVSVGPGGMEGNGASHYAFTSYDGRFLVFESYARNWFDDGPPNAIKWSDIFYRDLQTGEMAKISIG